MTQTLERLDVLIKEARSFSLNSDYSDDSGIPQSFFISAAQNANVALNRAIVKEVPEVFADYIEINAVQDEDEYDQPTDIFAENMVYSIDYSADGNTASWYPLDKGAFREAQYSGEPEEYVLDNGKIFISPTPNSSSGIFRVRYEKRKDNLDIRRGKVESITGTLPSPLTIVLVDDSWLSTELAEPFEYVCINDAYGTILMRNVPIDSYDETTHTLTIVSGFESEDGETLPVGSYVTIGKDTTTHPKYSYMCKDYFLTYMQLAAMDIHSSTDSIETNPKLREVKEEIAEIYRHLPSGKTGIPERRAW